MEIYFKITRDLSKEGTLQIGKEMVCFYGIRFLFFAIFLQVLQERCSKAFLFLIGIMG